MTDETKIPSHRRFLWRLSGKNAADIGIVTPEIMNHQIHAAFDYAQGTGTNKCPFDNEDKAFEATFKYGSEFIRWIDTEWKTS